jgi:hypothetical protein
MANLVIGDDGAGPRHYLTGRAVHAGNNLEMLTETGWQPVRYEAEWTDDSLTARLLLPDERELVVPGTDVELRWPGTGRNDGT